jgi:hypothetical protein
MLKSKAGDIDARPLTASSAKPLATHGRTIHQGQNRKNSNRASVFRCSLTNGHSAVLHCPLPTWRPCVFFQTARIDTTRTPQQSSRSCRTMNVASLFDRFAGRYMVGAYHFHRFSKSALYPPPPPRVNRSIIDSCCENPNHIIGSRFVAARAHIKVAERVQMLSVLPRRRHPATQSPYPFRARRGHS